MKIFYTLLFLTLIILIGGFVYNTFQQKEEVWAPGDPDEITGNMGANAKQPSNFAIAQNL